MPIAMLTHQRTVLVDKLCTAVQYCAVNVRVRPRFFDQVGHQTTSNASIENKYFFTK